MIFVQLEGFLVPKYMISPLLGSLRTKLDNVLCKLVDELLLFFKIKG